MAAQGVADLLVALQQASIRTQEELAEACHENERSGAAAYPQDPDPLSYLTGLCCPKPSHNPAIGSRPGAPNAPMAHRHGILLLQYVIVSYLTVQYT